MCECVRASGSVKFVGADLTSRLHLEEAVPAVRFSLCH